MNKYHFFRTFLIVAAASQAACFNVSKRSSSPNLSQLGPLTIQIAAEFRTPMGFKIALPYTAKNGSSKLQLVIDSAPQNGTHLVGGAADLYYTPKSNFLGKDAIRFHVVDGDRSSNTVETKIEAYDPGPMAFSRTETTLAGKSLTVVFVANCTPAVFSVTSNPTSGTLSNAVENLVVYTPNAGFIGNDRFTYKVTCSAGASAPAPVDISVRAPRAAPFDHSIVAAEGETRTIDLSTGDTNSSPATYTFPSLPTHGTLSGQAPNIQYTPANGYRGQDSFVYTMSRNGVSLGQATVSVRVVAPLVVTNTSDSGPGSLREALSGLAFGTSPQDISTPAHRVTFNIGGGGKQTILLSNDLPIIESSVTLDATTQPGYAGKPLIGISKPLNAVTGNYGFYLNASDITIKGFAVYGIPYLFYVTERAKRAVIQANYIGIDQSGVVAQNRQTFGVQNYGDTTRIEYSVLAEVQSMIETRGNNTLIRGNYFGVMPDKTAIVQRTVVAGSSIRVNGIGNVIGGSTVQDANVFGGYTTTRLGVVSIETGDSHLVGNYFCVFPDGTAIPNTSFFSPVDPDTSAVRSENTIDCP